MFRRILLLCVLMVPLASCQARTHVDVLANADGSGRVEAQVRLDAEAAAAVPDLQEQLRTSDLVEAGWSVDAQPADEGGLTVSASRSFANPAEADSVMSQLGGPDGAFRDFRLTQQRSVLRAETKFTGTVDLSRGIESFGDEELRSRVGSRLGFDPNEASSSLGFRWEEVAPVEVEVHLPGSVREVTPVPADGVWAPAYGGVTQLNMVTSGLNVWPLAFVALAACSLLGAIAVALLWRNYRPQHSAKKGGIRAKDLLAENQDNR